MGIWLDALDQAACGDMPGALERVRLDLPLALRRFVATEEGSRTYAGPVMSAVRRFRASKTTLEQGRIAQFDCELVDAIVDDVVAAVERALALVDLCLEDPQTTAEDLVARFPWAPGLKRDADWKRAWIADMLRSMLAEEIPLPAVIAETLGESGEARFGFDEVAFAAAPDRVDLTWKSLQRRLGLDGEYACLHDDESDTGVGAEGVDFGGVRMSRIAFEGQSRRDVEMDSALHLLGKDLTRELTVLLEAMHEAKPVEGFRPVAWHCVFWNLESDYEGLRMALHLLDPYCGTDGELAHHIAERYAEVASTSRVAVLRRRHSLSRACEERIRERIRERITGT